MNKPNWKDAPEWAQWLAQDRSGNWLWYSKKPTPNEVILGMGWPIWIDGGKSVPAGDGPDNPNWRDTLERRPEVDRYGLPLSWNERVIKSLKALANAQGCSVSHEDVDRARDLLRELGEWPEAKGEPFFSPIDTPVTIRCQREFWAGPIASNLEAGKPGC